MGKCELAGPREALAPLVCEYWSPLPQHAQDGGAVQGHIAPGEGPWTDGRLDLRSVH